MFFLKYLRGGGPCLTITFCRSLLLKPKNTCVTLPITPFLGKQLLELSQRDDPSFDRGSVWDGLATEVIRHNNVLTLLLFHGFVSVEEREGRKKIIKSVASIKKKKKSLIKAFKGS